MPCSPTDTIRFLTLDELGRLLAATRASVRDRALFLLAYRHGLRASEAGLRRAPMTPVVPTSWPERSATAAVRASHDAVT